LIVDPCRLLQPLPTATAAAIVADHCHRPPSLTVGCCHWWSSIANNCWLLPPTDCRRLTTIVDRYGRHHHRSHNNSLLDAISLYQKW